jgi:Acetyltransferase (GNAT) domain
VILDSPSHYISLPQRSFNLGETTLTTVSQSDVESIRKWRNRQMHVLRQNSEISVSEQVEYFRQNVFSEFVKLHPKQVLFSIHSKTKMVGYGGLVHIDWTNSISEISFLLKPEIEEGSLDYVVIFDNFLKLIQEVAFEKLEIDRLFTETYNFRFAHIEVIEGNKFRRIAIPKSYHQTMKAGTSSVFHEKQRREFGGRR